MDRKTILWLVALVFVLRCGLGLAGFDRRPLMITNDEAVIHDAAWAWAKHDGLRAASMEGLELGQLFFHYPPLSSIVQGEFYRVFGFSTAVIRLPSMAAHILGMLLLLWILRQGVRNGLIDSFAAWVGGALALADPFLLIFSRIGRMEHLGAMLGLAGIAFAFGASSPAGAKNRFLKWLAGSLFIGLALGTHPSAVVYQIFFYAMLVAARRELGWKRVWALFAMPGVTFLVIWTSVFGMQSLEAFQKMNALAGITVHPNLGEKLLWNGIVHHSFPDLGQLGGTAYFLVMGGWLLLLLRSFLTGPDVSGVWRKSRWIFAAAAMLQLASAWKMELYSARIIIFAPLAGINLAIGLAFLPKPARRVALAGTALAVGLGLVLTADYYWKLARHWNQWSADRFAAMTASVPKEAKVASTFELWHEWMKANRPFRMVDPSVRPDDAYWLNEPSRFADYDVVILSSRTEAQRQAALKAGVFHSPAWSEETVTMDEGNYYIYRKQPR